MSDGTVGTTAHPAGSLPDAGSASCRESYRNPYPNRWERHRLSLILALEVTSGFCLSCVRSTKNHESSMHLGVTTTI